MFNNLIESSSHKREFKRRGSFFLFTVTAYTLLFAVGGIASIYAYDAQLDEQNAEITFLTFVPPPPLMPERPAGPTRPTTTNPNPNPHNTVASAPVLYENTTSPHTVPPTIETAGHNLPVVGLGIRRGPVNNPLNTGPSGPGISGPGGPGPGKPTTVEVEIPPPAAVPTPAPKRTIVSRTILNSVAIYLPKPPYPAIAKQIHLSGSVSIQVLIDETGKVVSARTVSGSAMLAPAAEQAARQARFSPTMIGDSPVKVSGIIVYNFVMQ
jgi:periplasmic protein TonB